MSTTHDQRIRLALFIIERHFGEITRDVAATLLTTEHATLQQVVRKCGGTGTVPTPQKTLSPADVRAALLVLLHHNCLTVHLPPQVNVDGDAPSVAADRLKQTGLVYALSVGAVLQRLRIPKLAMHAAAHCGTDVAASIVKELAVHGRLRVWQVCEQLALEMKQQRDDRALIEARAAAEEYERAHAEEDGEDAAAAAAHDQFVAPLLVEESPEAKEEALRGFRDEVRGVFTQLVRRRLVVPVPYLDIQAQQKERREANAQTLERIHDKTAAAGAAAAPAKGKRKRTAAADDADAAAAGGGQGGAGGGRGEEEVEVDWGDSLWASSSVVVKEETDVGGSSGGGAARVVSLSDAACSASDEHLWMLGWAQFSREERHRLAVQVARKRHGDVAADAVAAILALSMPTERTAAAAESAASPFLRIYQHMHHRPGSKSGAAQPVYRSYTEAMAAMVKSRPAATATAAASSGAHSKTPPHPHPHPVAQLTAALAHLRADGVVKLVEPSVFAARGAAPGGGVDGPCYTVALAHVVASQRRIALRDVVAGRYGEGSARIVELLRAQMHTEQQHVAEKAIMPAREARERLYRLHRDGWIQYLEVARRPDFAPVSTSYFWFVDVPKLERAAAELAHRSLANTLVRRHHYYQSKQDLIAREQRTPEEDRAFGVVVDRMDALDTLVERLSDSLLLLENY